jgi:hypothetical protein
MPHSWHFPTGIMLDHLDRLKPSSMLEIGPGFGKWGFLAREMLDWSDGRLERSSWTARIDAIEAYAYETPLYEWVYDDVRFADVLDVAAEIADYDLVLMSDVIEHIEKEPAQRLLRDLLARNRNVLISTPLDFFEQEVEFNPHEDHVSHWTPADFDGYTADLDVAGGAALVALLAGRGATLPTARRAKVSRVLQRVPGIARRGSIQRDLKRLLS